MGIKLSDNTYGIQSLSVKILATMRKKKWRKNLYCKYGAA